jgi:peroxiredoxin
MFKSQKAIYLVVGLVGGLIVAIIANKVIFSNAASQNTQVDVVPVIKTDFIAPSSKYFNNQAIDPTQIINISPNNTTQPFSSGQ